MNHLDDFPERLPIGLVALGEGLLGAFNGANCTVEMFPLLGDDAALFAKRGHDIRILPIE